MAGNKAGAEKAKKKMLLKYGEDYYQKLGMRGGKISNKKKGFGGMSKEKRTEAGRKGGTNSRRGKK